MGVASGGPKCLIDVLLFLLSTPFLYLVLCTLFFVAGGLGRFTEHKVQRTKYKAHCLPFHTAFFGRVDFSGGRNFAKQEAFDVVKKKVLRVGIR